VVADTPGNTYKTAIAIQPSFNFWYTYNSKALRPGDTISVHKSGPMLAMACGFSGIVTTQDPLTTAALYFGYNTRPSAPVPAGDLIVAGLMLGSFTDGPSNYIPDTLHAWSLTDFIHIPVEGSSLFGSSLKPPRPAGNFTWSPQFTPQGSEWDIIISGFTAAVTVNMTAVGIATASPTLVPGIFSMFGKMAPIGITTASPFIEAPTTGIEAPYVVCLTHRDEPDMMVALHTNYNVAFGLELQPHSLVGRSSDGVGMAERITVVAPLLLVDKTLILDTTFNDAQIADILARLSAVETKAQAAVDSVANLATIVSSLSDAVTALQSAVAELQVSEFGGSTGVHLPIAALVVGSPAIGVPTPGLGGN
jgi:hypothetical protein